MSSRRSVRQLLVAVLLGVLVGGGLMAVTPAGAEVSNAVATNWKKIWKKNLKPLADKRYYTKAQSDAKYSTKAETAAGDTASTAAANSATDSKLSGYYKKTESDAKYAAAGSSYTKAEADAKYAPFPSVIRGTTIQATSTGAAGDQAGDNISFGVTLSAAPTPHYIPAGAAVPAGCSGTAASPNASPGHLCVFEVYSSNNGGNQLVTLNGTPGATATGALLFATATAAGQMVITTSWAVRPLGLSATVAKGADRGESVFAR